VLGITRTEVLGMRSFRSILSIPPIYRIFWNVVGGPRYLRTFSEEYVQAKPGYRLLDIGCGTGHAVPFFPNVKYVGFDMSPEYIESARKRFPQATFICQRVSHYIPVEREEFDVVLALGVLHHLDDAEAHQLFEIAHRALKSGGKLLTFDGVFTKDQSALARYFISRDRGRYVRDRDGYTQIASRVFFSVKSVVRHDLLRIPYTHMIMECTR
jgi:cyclopropane fatty-acyl-phospholipid synthase-like methyltransferase